MRAFNLLIAVVAAMFCLVPGAQAADRAARSNKEVFDDVCRMAADSALYGGGITRSTNVHIRFSNAERTDFFRTVLLDCVRAATGAVFAAGEAADTIIVLGIEDVRVAYGPAFRERWLGERKTERTAAIAVRCEMQQRSTGKMFYAGTIRRVLADTIAVGDIGRLNASSDRIAAGEKPEVSLWEKIVEPAILTVSSGIAIYLFFTVRS